MWKKKKKKMEFEWHSVETQLDWKTEEAKFLVKALCSLHLTPNRSLNPPLSLSLSLPSSSEESGYGPSNGHLFPSSIYTCQPSPHSFLDFFKSILCSLTLKTNFYLTKQIYELFHRILLQFEVFLVIFYKE